MRPILAIVALAMAASTQSARFRTGVEAVQVDVLVLDGRTPVGGLTSADFALRDAGVAQQIESVAIADVPLSVLVALDVSSSVSGSTLENLKAGVRAAYTALLPRDRSALIAFSNELKLRSDWSNSAAGAAQALETLEGGGGTSLVDAMFAALIFVDPTPQARRLVLVFSDGEDTSSWLPRGAVLDKARQSDSVVYGVVMKDARLPIQHERLLDRSGIELTPGDERLRHDTPFLEEVAAATGGRCFTTASTADLKDAFTRVLTEFRTRYVLTYTPHGVDRDGWHPLDVRLTNGKGRVTARRGYQR